MDTTTPIPQPDDDPRDETTPVAAAEADPVQAPTPRRRKLLAVAGLAVALPAIGLVSYGVTNAAGADDATDEVEDEPTELVCEEWVPTPEDVETLNAEADSLAAFFDQRGIEYTVETDEHDIRMVVWDENDEAANQAWDEWAAEYYPTDDEADAEMQAEEDALAAYLDERGIAYTRESDEYGISYVVVDENDDAAVQAVDEFWAQRYPLTPEEITEATEAEEALAAYLDEHGIAYTRETSPEGIAYVVVDENDDAAGQAVEDFYSEHYGDAEGCVGMIEVEATDDVEAEDITG